MADVHCLALFQPEANDKKIGIKNEEGAIVLSVYQNKETYKSETPLRVYRFDKKEMHEGNLTVPLNDLQVGQYGIALIDDQNDNGKMDYRICWPTEGFGFSNYCFKGTKKPDFELFAFQLSDLNTEIWIQVKYFK